ncbi:MAG: lambda-exonuclease family protein [Alphaproteobacteria bacterium]
MEVTREQWLEERKKGIGGSDAAAIVGCNPYMTNVQLWEIKTGRKEQADISNKDCVQYGVKAENPLRELFKLDYPEYEVVEKGFDIIRHPRFDFLSASLDGELTEKSTGRKGILEIKTTNILQSMQLEKWNDRIPQNYYCQILHYLGVTGYDFAILKAQLKSIYDGQIRITQRHYFFKRENIQDDIEFLQKEEIKFWQQYVAKDIKPNLVLPQI